MNRIALTTLLMLALLSGCATTGGGRTTVTGTGPQDMLKLRAGPGLGFRVVLGLPEGTELIRRDCVTEMGQLWCRVSLADAPGMTGYVSADYLSGS
ncbi:SH3 domain-containing protein [Thetidibacter halocola]|uniref:SH3 domain-containing protein n=1 Tax=Thetidibacter halocola TaxID=2827239 RepID=A0A8J8BC38_9RHOB|nr:SH3 domain-containing protein [Thetidibacter halocola]MBS0126873.1 SH3 domain-containing protein [Thetidibacter halocola]